MSDTTILGYSGQNVNPNKILHLKMMPAAGGSAKDWPEALAPNGIADDFFAPGIGNLLTLPDGLSAGVTTDYSKPLAELLKKFKESPASRVLTGATTTLQMAGSIAEGDDASPLSKLAVIPPNVRFQTNVSHLPAWKETKPMAIKTFEFTFYLGMAGVYDGRTEVYNPILALAGINLPTKFADSARLRGPLASSPYIMGQMAKTAGDLLKSGGTIPASNVVEQYAAALDNFSDSASTIMDKQPGTVRAQMGKVKLPRFYVATTEYSFSADTDDNGYPIFGKVTWSGCTSMEIPHKGTDAYILHGGSSDNGLASAQAIAEDA